MEVTKFIKRKNEIIYNLTGIILVPEDQIAKVPKYKLHISIASNSCPYCHVYNQMEGCNGCPMNDAGNTCAESENNTWDQLVDWVRQNTGSESVTNWYQSIPEMVKLYKKYNKQFTSVD